MVEYITARYFGEDRLVPKQHTCFNSVVCLRETPDCWTASPGRPQVVVETFYPAIWAGCEAAAVEYLRRTVPTVQHLIVRQSWHEAGGLVGSPPQSVYELMFSVLGLTSLTLYFIQDNPRCVPRADVVRPQFIPAAGFFSVNIPDDDPEADHVAYKCSALVKTNGGLAAEEAAVAPVEMGDVSSL
jgi:hypothetical protein